jgi:molecular chaperone DnaK
MHVAAKDRGTGKAQSIVIKSDSGLSKEDIERMVKDAELHAAEDHKRRELVDARNALDGLVYRTEKNLEELGADVDAAISAEVKSAIEKAKTVLDSDDAEKMTTARNELEQSAHKLAEALYKKAQQQGAAASEADASAGGASANGGKGDDDNVVDADFEEVKP